MAISDKELGCFIKQHEALLYKAAWDYFQHKSFAASVDDVRDAVSEAMYRMCKYKDKFTPSPDHPHPLTTWACLIVRQSCYCIMQQYPDVRYYDTTITHVPSAVPLWTNRSEPTPEEICIKRETIVYHWDLLNPTQRRVIYLRYMGLDEHEIGFELGVTNVRVKSILSSARRKSERHARLLHQQKSK